jgi:hypothetical protein
MSKYVDMWLEGWRRGDADLVLQSVTDDFVHDDPVDGRFTKSEFEVYLRELFADVEAARAKEEDAVFEVITDVVTAERDGEEITWGWWSVLPYEGAGLVRSRADGVYSERVAYYTRP